MTQQIPTGPIAPDQLVLIHHPDFDPAAGQIAMPSGGAMSLPTAVGDPDACAFRVAVSPHQAVVGFPKFGTIGVGFEEEDDWNANLPYTAHPEALADHISHNRLAGGDAEVPRATVLAAIALVRGGAARLEAYGMRCANVCQGIKGDVARGLRDDDPTAGLEPHWGEDCPLADPALGGWFGYSRSDEHPRDADGWPVKDRDDEDGE